MYIIYNIYIYIRGRNMFIKA